GPAGLVQQLVRGGGIVLPGARQRRFEAGSGGTERTPGPCVLAAVDRLHEGVDVDRLAQGEPDLLVVQRSPHGVEGDRDDRARYVLSAELQLSRLLQGLDVLRRNIVDELGLAAGERAVPG